VLRYIVSHLRAKKQVVEVCATTGISAIQIGGRTIHSFAGIELGTFFRKKLLNLAWRRKDEWRNTQTLIIDEVSCATDTHTHTHTHTLSLSLSLTLFDSESV
jgi:ATP-dependent DNA helicase PIF1